MAYSFAGTPPNPLVSIFRLCSLYNPEFQQLYDFYPEDVYGYKVCNVPDGLYGCDYDPQFPSLYERDSVIVRIPLGSATKYHFAGNATSPNPFNINRVTDTGFQSMEVSNARLIDTMLMPEEYRQPSVCYYHPDDTSYCVNSPYYFVVPSYINGVQEPYYFEGPIFERAYKAGLGQVHYYYSGASIIYFETHSSDLIYYKDVLHECGADHLLDIAAVATHAADIRIYPNPANDELSIKTVGGEIYSISINNIFGQSIYQATKLKDAVTINTSVFPPGIYTVVIVDGDGYRRTEKVVIAH